MHRLQDPGRDQGKTGTGLVDSIPEPYVGRFAPSPTGPLHQGSLICALASFLDARSRKGQWLMRMEDLDPPREQAGAAHGILHSLRAHGLEWDGAVLWQSERHAAYDSVIDDLLARGLAFRCDCSRRSLAASGGRYTGHCRERGLAADSNHAVRIRIRENTRISVHDRLQLTLEQDLARDVGDFVIRRRDRLAAYQLAVVIDDAWQGVTHVVRGSDLYDSTPRQVYLQRLLGLPTPVYTHIPVLTNTEGYKLSKQTFAAAVDNSRPAHNLRQALEFLNQTRPPQELAAVTEILDWANRHWQAGAIPARLQIPESCAD